MVMIPNLLFTGIESSSLENLQKSAILHQILKKLYPFSNYYWHQFQLTLKVSLNICVIGLFCVRRTYGSDSCHPASVFIVN